MLSTNRYILGIDKDDEHEEEDEERISLLEVRVPQGLSYFGPAVTRKQAPQLKHTHTHAKIH